MSATHWIRIAPIESVPPREGRAVLLGDREVALFNLGPSTALGAGDQFLATDNQCPHNGGPLCDGIVAGASVVCPLHAWKVNLATGAVERPSHGRDHCVITYPTRVEDGVVLIGLLETQAGAPDPSTCSGSPRASSRGEGAPYGDAGSSPDVAGRSPEVGHPFRGANPGAAA